MKPEFTIQQLRLVQAMADFQIALSALTFLCEFPDGEQTTRITLRRYRCFQDMAVIAYWRPFSKTNGLPFLSFKQIGVKPTPEQKALHDRIGDIRNKVVAHTDADHVRIAYQTADVLDGLMMPHMEFYEGLDLYDDRWRWMEWIRVLMGAGGKKLFAEAQGRSALSVVKDSGPIRAS
jgi:hypothetical protein